jgi:hydroxymethylpyrimidine pyrophosphatase-like HAD family hydrolase
MRLIVVTELARQVGPRDLAAAREAYVFAGDSPNDAPMFAFFPQAVGVANVRRFLPRIATPPAYVTTNDSGAGFAELVEALLAPA